MDKLTMQSAGGAGRNLEKLAELFPNVITEARDAGGRICRAVDWELLKQLLSDEVVEGDKERYQLTWPGKKAAVAQANAPVTHTLRPVREDSADWDRTENVYIEGDNLDVLKLLQESYLGRVKMIYIDPPYNTGNDFIYKDDFRDAADRYLERSGHRDGEGNRLVANPAANGRFHSDWLSMMYSRLLVARNLLREDGVIFISIDDHEADNLRKLCDEVFGGSSFIAQIVWQKVHTRKNSARFFSESHEYILCYAKRKKLDAADPGWERNLLPRENNDAYKNPDNDLKGPWKPDPITAHNPYSADYTITKPNGIVLSRPQDRYWALSEESWLRKVRDNEVIWGEGESYPMVKRYLSEVQNGLVPVTLFDREFAGDSAQANRELKELFGLGALFPYPKPSKLIRRLLQIATGPDDLVLDFFSGSASTAHAVMRQNVEDGGRRRYILVQLPEVAPEESEAYKAGYSTLCEIGKERIRRAAAKVREETGAELDYGFRVYRLDSSNMKEVYYRPEEWSQQDLFDYASNVKEDRTGEDLLVQVMLENGLELSLPMETLQLGGSTVYLVGGGELMAAFEPELEDAVFQEIAGRKPRRAVFRDASFRDDAARINAEELFKRSSRHTTVQVL
ncbi:site-specific DNA-methyltransferase [Gorillibacterium sp. sgz5001074]|uniref:site-specific DNA-methyltransferase n=1 Tax=Gorillibacterium sp. sgz5001074 TaxID=3446695 RepID=UPI003F672A8B